MTLAHIALIVFAAAYLIMPLIIRLAKRFVVVDHPADHKIHSDPTPRGGGISLVFAWLCGALLLTVFDLGTDSRLVMGLIVGGVLIAVIGLLDDFVEVRPRTKLIGQTVAATAFVAISAPTLQLGAQPLLAIVWIVFFVNAFNLIDGLDGLAAGLAAIAAAQFALLAAAGGASSTLGPSILLVGACLGFLPYNWRPAKIFMGDTGSLFLGFLLAALATVNFTATTTVSIAAAPLFVIVLPVFDTLLTVSRRIVNRESLFRADTDHFYNRLMEHGFSHRGSVVFTLALSAILGAGGLALALADATPVWVAAGFVIMGTGLSALVRKYGLIVTESVLED